jgi:LytS/YehU family sensor histidine kinase
MNANQKTTAGAKDRNQVEGCSKTTGHGLFFSHVGEDVDSLFQPLRVTSGIQLREDGADTPSDLILRSWNGSLAHSRPGIVGYHEEQKQNEVQQANLRSLVNRSRLNVLMSQINPHFFFNALDTFGALVEENPAEARRLISKMANIFRQTLRASEREMISLREELSFIEDYLEIEKARFGERLRVEQMISSDVIQARIPCFTLQLLVENAIKHGASPKIGTSTICIAALQPGDWIQIQVSDDGVGMTEDSLNHILERGHGLRNVVERLNILYASEFSWRVQSEFQKGTTVTLRLPFSPPSNLGKRSRQVP